MQSVRMSDQCARSKDENVPARRGRNKDFNQDALAYKHLDCHLLYCPSMEWKRERGVVASSFCEREQETYTTPLALSMGAWLLLGLPCAFLDLTVKPSYTHAPTDTRRSRTCPLAWLCR